MREEERERGRAWGLRGGREGRRHGQDGGRLMTDARNHEVIRIGEAALGDKS